MKIFPLVASFCSRLQADIAMIRLRRAGIAPDRISAVFPRRLIPNAAACWLATPERPILQLGDEAFLVAGRWGAVLADAVEDPSIPCRLESAGCSQGTASLVIERLRQGGIVLSVDGHSGNEAALAWQALRECAAEIIALGGELPGTALAAEGFERSPAAA